MKTKPRKSRQQLVRERAALVTAISLLGGQAKFARHFGITPQAIQGWLKRGIHWWQAPAIERLTGGRVPRQQLAEDYEREVAPSEVRQ